MTCLIQSTALKDLTLLPLLPGYLLEQGEGFKVKGKASVQSDMKLHSKRSADKKPRPISLLFGLLKASRKKGPS